MRVGRGARRVRRYGASGVKRSGGRHWRALRSELPVRGREPQRREVPHVPPSGASLSPARRSASQRTALLLSTCIGAVWRVSGPAQAGRRAPNWPPVHADGAAVFALLQRSSLRRRLALTLRARPEFNDPVAVFLVVGFIEWQQQPGYGPLDFVLLFVQEMGTGAIAGVAVGALAVKAFTRARLDTPGLYPVASLATLMVAYGSGEPARLRLPGGLPRRRRAGTRQNPGAAHGQDVPPGPRVGRAARDVRHALAAGLPQPARRGRARRHRAGSRPGPRRAPARGPGRDAWHRLHATRTGSARLGGPPRGGAGGPRDVSRAGRRAPQPRVLQHRLLRRASLDDPAGDDRRAARPPARPHGTGAGAPSGTERDGRGRRGSKRARRCSSTR